MNILPGFPSNNKELCPPALIICPRPSNFKKNLNDCEGNEFVLLSTILESVSLSSASDDKRLWTFRSSRVSSY